MNFFYFILFLNFTILYWFCQILKWIRHRYTCVPHPEPSALLPPPSPVPVHQPQASGIMHRTWTGDSFHIWYYTYFNAILPNHPMSEFNSCFLPCIQVSQEMGKVVWYSHLFKNFPRFVVIHTVKGFNQWSSSRRFSGIPLPSLWSSRCWQFWSLVPLPFLNPVFTPGSSQFTYCGSLAWRILSITLLACEMSTIIW